jgi:hypothetical protein
MTKAHPRWVPESAPWRLYLLLGGFGGGIALGIPTAVSVFLAEASGHRGFLPGWLAITFLAVVGSAAGLGAGALAGVGYRVACSVSPAPAAVVVSSALGAAAGGLLVYLMVVGGRVATMVGCVGASVFSGVAFAVITALWLHFRRTSGPQAPLKSPSAVRGDDFLAD